MTSHAGYLLPVLHRGQPAMLKLAKGEDERAGSAVLEWWDGNGAARVLARHDDALLMERAQGPASLSDMARGGQDDEASRISAPWRRDCTGQGKNRRLRWYRSGIGFANSRRPQRPMAACYVAVLKRPTLCWTTRAR
jgi:hypothetical protein